MARSRDTDGILTALPSGGRFKRLAIVIAVPLLALLVLFLILWNTFFKYVPPGKMLVIVSKSGALLDAGQVLAGPGQKGIQRAVHGEGWHFVLPIVYTTELVPNVVIKPGFVGVVTSLGGATPPGGRVIAEHGERGILREVLLPGSYRLNPYGFKVEEVKMTEVQAGYVGVMRRLLASKDGKEGILRDRILQPGIYPINPKEFEVLSCEVGIYQTSYSYKERGEVSTAITFPARDGNTISLDCTVEWELRPEFWADWLTTFRTMKNIERIVIDQHARKICRDRGLNYGAQDFLEGDKREKFQVDFRTELDRACGKHNVLVRSAFIRNIIIPETFLEQKRMERLATETKLTSEALALTADSEALVAEAKQTIELKVQKVKAETEKLVAAVERETLSLTEVTKAELEKMKDEFSAKIALVDAERKQALGEAEAEAKMLKDTAESELFKLKMDVFGRDADAYLRYTLAKELNPKLRLRLFQAGAGTLWTNMGNKDMNFMLPLPGGEGKSAADKLNGPVKPD